MPASISYPPIPIFELGPVRLSLHGVMAGVGFVVGCWLMIREGRRRGFDEAKIVSVLAWGLVGAVIGARVFTIPAHLDEGLAQALNPFSYFSIMGGFAGGILAAWWRMRLLGLDVAVHLDLAAPGLALGTVVGRLGDLFIVEHLGSPTRFFLGFLVKPGYDLAPQHDALEVLCETGVSCGPYHFPALYDLVGAAVLLVVLQLLARHWSRLRYGVTFLVWVGWYGMQRFLIDFTRNTDFGSDLAAVSADATLGPFTWSQWAGLALAVSAFALAGRLVLRRVTPLVSTSGDRERGAEPVPTT